MIHPDTEIVLLFFDPEKPHEKKLRFINIRKGKHPNMNNNEKSFPSDTRLPHTYDPPFIISINPLQKSRMEKAKKLINLDLIIRTFSI